MYIHIFFYWTKFIFKLQVRFANEEILCKAHPIIKWAYVYRAARKGPWEQYARDRERFRVKIDKIQCKLDKVLDPTHRDDIFQSRFKTWKNWTFSKLQQSQLQEEQLTTFKQKKFKQTNELKTSELSFNKQLKLKHTKSEFKHTNAV